MALGDALGLGGGVVCRGPSPQRPLGGAHAALAGVGGRPPRTDGFYPRMWGGEQVHAWPLGIGGALNESPGYTNT